MNSVLMRMKQRLDELERKVEEQKQRIETLEALNVKRPRNSKHSKQREIRLG